MHILIQWLNVTNLHIPTSRHRWMWNILIASFIIYFPYRIYYYPLIYLYMIDWLLFILLDSLFLSLPYIFIHILYAFMFVVIPTTTWKYMAHAYNFSTNIMDYFLTISIHNYYRIIRLQLRISSFKWIGGSPLTIIFLIHTYIMCYLYHT